MYFNYDNNIERYNSFEYRIKKFSNSIGCHEYIQKLTYVDARCSTRPFYIFDRQELEEWFYCICRENRMICGYCDCEECFTCIRFIFIKQRLIKMWFFCTAKRNILSAY